MGDNDLTILIETAIDLEKSLSTMTAQMNQLREKFKDYQIKITAGLNQTASAAQIKRDLAQINKAKNRVQLTGQMDRDATKKNIDSALKKLKDTEIKITGVLDSAATTSNIQSSLGDIHDVTARADIEVEGAGQVDDLRRKMDEASKSASGMAAQVYLARTALAALRTAAREAIETMTELDSAVTDLSMATGQSREQTYELLKDYNELAGQLGAITTQVAQAADQWLRQGHSISDTTTLIQDSMILSKVSQLDSAAATEYLTSAMKGYKIAAQDVIGVVDKLAAVDLESATDAGGLAEAMSRTAVTADMAGVSMDRLLGYLATVGEVTQKSMSSIGESFKTIFTRMSDIKANKLELIDEDGTVETLSDVELTLKNVGIDLRKTVNEYNNYGDILDDLAAKWDTLSQVQQNALAKAFAGTRQGENFRVLMENYSTAMEYMNIAADSAGTATEKFALYMDSVEAKAASFTAAVESLTMDTIDSELVKDLIDAGTAIVELAEKAGLLKAALLSLGAGAVMKGVQTIAVGFKNVSQNVLNLGESINILRRVGDVSSLAGETISRLGTLTKGLSDDQLKLVLTSRQLSSAQMQAVLRASGLTAEEAAQKLETLGLAASQETAAGATWSLSAAMQGLGASIKAAMVANPIGTMMMAISAATVVVSLFANAWEDAKQKAEEARQSMIEAAEASNAQRESLSELIDEYKSLASAGDFDQSSREQARDIQQRITDLVGEQAANLDLVNGKLDKEIEKLSEAEAKQAQQNKGALDTRYRDATKRFNEGIHVDGSSTNFSGLIKNDGHYQTALQAIGVSLERARELIYMDQENAQEVLDNFREIQSLLLSDSAWEKHQDEIAFGPDHYEILNQIQAEIDFYQNIVDEYNTARRDFFENEAIIDQFNYLKANDIDTQEAFDAYIAGIQSSSEYSNEYKDILVELATKTFPEFAEGAGLVQSSVESAGNTFQTYQARLSDLSETLSELQTSYDALQAAENDMAGGGGLSADTIKALADAEENYIDYLYEENGVVKLNTEAWKENANAKMQRELDEIQAEIDAIERENAAIEEQIKEKEALRLAALEAQDLTSYYAYYSAIDSLNGKISANNELIAENQGKLAMYSALYGSITGDMDAYTAALQNFSNVANTIDTMTSSFQVLANLQAEVADGFTMSLDRALEFAKVYPEILNSAQVCADGQIMLNEGVVNSFIEGKKAELDAQIDALVAELEADKAAKQAKLESAQVQLELAKAVAEGEGEITKELAEYRINAGNAVAQALIDAGIDEATAFKLAAAAMAQNAEEFDRVATQVCTDVNGNFNQAAFDLAQTMYKNLTNVKTDLASVARQAHQTAKAIAGIADGTVQGSEGIQGGSGGGVGGSGIKLSLTSGSFEGTEYTYTAKESNLEDFISQIELDISNYENAIKQIDGQIAALQALKNTPLKKFEGKGVGAKSSSESGSGSASKEVEEYISDINKYRDAVEALRKAQEEAARIESEIENAGSYEKKIALEKELVEAYKAEQAALHDLNDARDATISESVEALKALGFEVEYNADTNELWISNMEHLNELTADSKGNYNSLQEATNALRKNTEDLIGTITSLNDENRKGSEQWLELQKSIIKATVAQYEYALQVKKNSIMLAEDGMNNAINTQNLADVKKFSTDIIHEYEAMQRTLHEEAEYYRSLGYSDTSDEVSKLSNLWWDYADNIKKVKGQVVDYLIEIVDAAHDSVDEIQNVSDVLRDAADEFAANDGFLTVDTIQALLKLCPQYMQMLKAENGLWEINEERINAVVAARTQQLAVENAMSYVERLKLAAQQGSIEDLDNLIFATTEATSSTWGLVYAELELMHTMGELNDSQYQAALHNIQAMQDLAENAIQNIGKATDSVAKNLEETRKQLENTKKGLQDLLDELEDMQDGANDLIKYVMDMLKHRIKEQINLLEEMKDKYSELIRLKKDSLDATKDEQDYQKTIAKKLKEMAKLQERINALSLDDSRSAQAERAKLLEELAALQEDLSDTQASKSIEAQKDALDQMEEDYHTEKDKEIKILEDSISS